MRFLQLFNCYPQALREFYSRWPELHFASFAEQTAALNSFGFSSGYLYAPYLGRFGYEPFIVYPNDPVSQSQWARENGVAPKNGKSWLREITAAQIEKVKPDVLFVSEPLEFDSRFLRTLTFKPRVILGWRAAPIPGGTDWSSFDAILSNLTAVREVALTLGAKRAFHFWPGFERRIAEMLAQVTPSVDVVFCGQWTKAHVNRNQIISELARRQVRQELGFSIALHISGDIGLAPPEVQQLNRGAKFGVEYYAALKSGLMALDARGTILDIPDPKTGKSIDLFRNETGTNRMLEVTGVGSMLLAEHFDVLKNYFSLNEEIVTFSSIDDLVAKARHYAAHRDQALAIAARGHARCMKEHSMEVRADGLHGFIQECLKPVPNEAPPEPQQLLASAIARLQAGDPAGALSALERLSGSGRIPPRFHFLKGLCLAKLGNVAEAVQSFDLQLQATPGDQETMLVRDELRAGLRER